MARTAAETASILSKLFDQHFGQEYSESYRITYPQLRSLAAVPRLNDSFLKGINVALSEFGELLIPLNNYLLIARENDFDHFRRVPYRIVEEYLPDGCKDTQNDGDQEIEDDI